MGEVGRPTKYREEYNEQAYKLCLLGATDAALADFFDVCVDTINEWKNVHVEFSASIKRGKLYADAEVASTLLKRAKGYRYDEVTVEKVDSKAGLEATDEGELKDGDAYRKRIITREMPPDPTSMIFWLKNRQPKEWRDKQVTELEGEIQTTTIQIIQPITDASDKV